MKKKPVVVDLVKLMVEFVCGGGGGGDDGLVGRTALSFRVLESPPSLPKQINIRIPFVDPSITVSKLVTNASNLFGATDEDYNLLTKNYSALIPVDAKAKDENHMSSVHFNGFTSINNLYITGHIDGTIHFWDVSCPFPLPIALLKHQNEDNHFGSAIPVTAMHFDIAPRILISGDQSGVVSLIDIEGPTLLFQQHIPSDLASGVISLQFGTCNFQGFEKNTLLGSNKGFDGSAPDVETEILLVPLYVSDDSDLNKRNSSLLLCNEKAVYIYSLPHVVQVILLLRSIDFFIFSMFASLGNKNVQFKKKFHGVSSCCWALTFCKHDSDVALALLFTSDKIEVSAIDEDGDAVPEWENLPPLVHISHCKAAPDLIYDCVPPLLLSLLS
ncbi:hypothetical protein Syun_017946 [Stephania yunnanensis]|uniref:Uncharacterized protein n=1 Tax=Stephania yunnanensis TaxID=152371 RepID=A0AAP0IRD5_9MAGN